MHDALTFGFLVLCVGGAALLAVQSHEVAKRVRIPAPALFLVAAALAVRYIPGLEEPPHRIVERVVTLALVVILFDGGMGIGIRRLRSAGHTVLTLGVLGTFATVAGAAVVVHLVLGVNWYLSVLVATAIAPSAPPRARLPVSPMKTAAGGALNHRKAKPAPTIAEHSTVSSPTPSTNGMPR